MNPGVAVLRFTMQRYWRMYVALLVYLAGLTVVAHVPKAWIGLSVVPILTIPFVMLLLATVFGFINLEADLASPGSAYPPFLLRLPVSTRTLACWPIFGTALWSGLVWAALATLYFRPMGIDVPILWPSAMIASVAVTLQAILWTPVRVGSFRILLAGLIPLALVLFGISAATSNANPGHLALLYSVVAILAGFSAALGLVQARAQPASGARVRSQQGSIAVRPARAWRPFRSAKRAQFWLEWRRQGMVLPLLTMLSFALLSLPLLWEPTLMDASFEGTNKVNAWVNSAAPLIAVIPLLLASAIGMGARRSELRGSEGAYHLFFVTKPIASSDMVRAKVGAITLGIVTTAVLTVGTLFLWSMIPAISAGQPVRTLQLWTDGMTLQDWLPWLGALVVGTAWAWRNQVVGAFVDYVPSRRLSLAYPVVICLIGSVAFGLFAGDKQQLENPSFHVWAIAFLAVLDALKIGVFTALGVILLRLRPSASRFLAALVGRWLVVALISSIALGWLAFRFRTQMYSLYSQTPVPELTAILIVPLGRPLAALVALERGRHR